MGTLGPALEGVVCNLARLRCGWTKLQLGWRFSITMQGSKWVYFKSIWLWVTVLCMVLLYHPECLSVPLRASCPAQLLSILARGTVPARCPGLAVCEPL